MEEAAVFAEGFLVQLHLRPMFMEKGKSLKRTIKRTMDVSRI